MGLMPPQKLLMPQMAFFTRPLTKCNVLDVRRSSIFDIFVWIMGIAVKQAYSGLLWLCTWSMSDYCQKLKIAFSYHRFACSKNLLHSISKCNQASNETKLLFQFAKDMISFFVVQTKALMYVVHYDIINFEFILPIINALCMKLQE